MTFKNSGRMDYVDFAKGIAIILITLFHLHSHYLLPVRFTVSIFDLGIIFDRGRIGIYLFIFLSGYLFAMSSKKRTTGITYSHYLLKRFARIAPAYYVAIFVWNILSPHLYSLNHNLTHVFFIHTFYYKTFFSITPTFWYIAVQMHLYVLAPVMMTFYNKNNRLTVVLAFLVALSTNTLLIKWVPKEIALYVTQSVLTYMFPFVLGFLLYEKKESIIRVMDNRIISVMFFVLTVFLILLPTSYILLINKGDLYFVILGFMLSVYIVSFSKESINYRKFPLRQIAFVGRCSYSIFLYNYIFKIHSPILNNLPGYIFYFFMVIAFGIGMHFAIERPLTTISTNLLNKHIRVAV
jgi:peptidoglycan/LPS O-acetylase OafA/YrhL